MKKQSILTTLFLVFLLAGCQPAGATVPLAATDADREIEFPAPQVDQLVRERQAKGEVGIFELELADMR